MIKIFHNNDSVYEQWLNTIGGYVYNDFGGRIVNYKKLHKSDCAMLHNVRSGHSKTSVRKICSDNLNELRQFVSSKKGGEGIGYSLCDHCFKTDISYSKVSQDNRYPNSIKHTAYSNENADRIAKILISIYNEKKIPKYFNNFYLPLGLTKKEVETDLNKIYVLIVLASYDRQPYTKVAIGWERIWGTERKDESLYTMLDEVGLLNLEIVNTLSKDEICNRLQQKHFYGYRIDVDRFSVDGRFTNYSTTIKDAAKMVTENKLLDLLIKASTPEDVKNIFNLLDSIHGIGLTIASKLMMYTLREIGIGQIPYNNLFPAVAPILKEYHNNELSKELERKYGIGFVIAIFESLKNLGDPFAIDALYYIHREEPSLKRLL